MKILEDWRVFLVLMTMAFAIVITGVGRPSEGQPSASAVIQISDPVDSWLGVGGDASGDLVLARTVAGNVLVSVDDGRLQFTANGPDAAQAQQALATALAAYEAARLELRSGLAERLEVVPGLAAFVAQRRALATASATAAQLSSIEGQLAGLPRSTLAPLWQETPVSERLSRIDNVLAATFWDVVDQSS